MSGEQVTALVAGLLLAAGCAYAGRRSYRAGDGVVTVPSVFAAVWSTVLLLFAVPWVRYTHSSTEAWIAVYGSIATFLVGSLLATRRAPADRSTAPEAIDHRRLRWLWLVCFVLGLVGFADFVYAVNVVIGWKSILQNPAVVRSLQSTSAKFQATYGALKLLTYFNQIAFLLWTIGLRERAFGRWWRIGGALGWVSIIPFLFTGDRTLILTALVWALAFHLVWRPVRDVRRLLVSLAVSAAVGVAIFTTLGAHVSKTINNHPEIRAQLMTRTLDSLALPFVYLTANVPTLSQLMKDPIRPHTHGEMTLLPLVKVAHAVGIGGTPPFEVGAFYPVPFETFNNYSWLGTFYLDFGLAGCLVLPAIVAYLLTRITLAALRRGRLVMIWMASLSLYVVGFSPLLNKLSTTLTWEYALVGPVAVLLIRAAPSPRDWLPDQRRRAAALARPVQVGTGVGIVCITVGLVVLAANRAPVVRSSAALDRELHTAFARALLTRRRGVFPSSEALASRLEVNDPSFLFAAFYSPTALPVDPGVIGVNARGSSLILRAHDRDAVYQTSTPAPFRPASTLGPGGNLLTDGGFDVGLGGNWLVASNGVAVMTVSAKPMWKGDTALMVRGTGKGGLPGTTTDVMRTLWSLPSAAAGSSYDLTFVARRMRLDRRVRVWVNLLYVDGSSANVLAHPLFGPAAASTGVPRGNDRTWRPYGTVAHAGKPLLAVQVFAADVGALPLKGTLYISHLSLHEL